MKRISPSCLLVFIFSVTTNLIFSQAGSLDNTFDFDGKVRTPVGVTDAGAYAVTLQTDGKIIAVGAVDGGSASDFGLVRYNTDGSLDITFDLDGKVVTDVTGSQEYAYAVKIQSDGKILVAGHCNNSPDVNFAILRYNSDGSLDNTFDADGKVIIDIGYDDIARSIAIQSDGKILVGGYSSNGSDQDFALVRCNVDGSLDSTFDSDGKLTTSFGSTSDYGQSVLIQTDGKILLAGTSYNISNGDFVLVRYNTDGSLDNSFDTDGKMTTTFGTAQEECTSAVLQSDGKILLAGYSTPGSSTDFAIARVNSNGSMDNTFDTDGKVLTDFGAPLDCAYSIAMLFDGRIIVSGYTGVFPNTDFALAQYNSNGSLDNGFDTDGKVVTNFGSTYEESYSLAVQSDGKIVVAGKGKNGTYIQFALARYNGSGGLDIQDSWMAGGVNVYPNPSSYNFKIDLTKEAEIVIYNHLGMLIEKHNAVNSTLVFGENYLTGVYFVSIHMNGQQRSFKVVKI